MQNVCGAFKIIRVSKVSEYMTPVTGYFKQFNFTSVIMIRSQLFKDWMTVSLFKSLATYHLCIQEGGNHSSLYGCLNYNPTVLCVLYDFLLLLYFNMITPCRSQEGGLLIYHYISHSSSRVATSVYMCYCNSYCICQKYDNQSP